MTMHCFQMSCFLGPEELYVVFVYCVSVVFCMKNKEIQNSSGNIAQFTNTVFLHEMNCPQLHTVLWSVISDLHLMIDLYVEYQQYVVHKRTCQILFLMYIMLCWSVILDPSALAIRSRMTDQHTDSNFSSLVCTLRPPLSAQVFSCACSCQTKPLGPMCAGL